MAPLAAAVRDHLAALGTPEELVFAVDLVLEELVSNVAKYAYGAGAGEVEVAVEPLDGAIAIRVSDRGRPFDPTTHPPLAPPADGGPEGAGGRGIHLVRRLARTFRWRREGDRNVVEVELAEDPP